MDLDDSRAVRPSNECQAPEVLEAVPHRLCIRAALGKCYLGPPFHDDPILYFGVSGEDRNLSNLCKYLVNPSNSSQNPSSYNSILNSPSPPLSQSKDDLEV